MLSIPYLPPQGDLPIHSTKQQQLQLVPGNDHLNRTGHNSKTNYPNSIL